MPNMDFPPASGGAQILLPTPVPGGGEDRLILRQATPEDADRLVDFHARVHSDYGLDRPDEPVGAWVRDLMSGTHPTFRPGDFTLVENARTGEIASSLCLISQTWTYDGIPFGVGLPELVGTLPAYRRRGLIRAQFDVVHRWSAERGELLQNITGIPYYYRQFGYEMALQLDGGRAGYRPQVPALGAGETEPFVLRPAADSEASFLRAVDETGNRRWRVACVRDEATWGYEIAGKSPANVNRRGIEIIETPAGEPVGFLAHPAVAWHGSIHATGYELKPGTSWLAVTPSVVRWLWKTGQAFCARDRAGELEAFVFSLGSDHPVFDVFREHLPRVRPPYARYMRVPDLPGFVRHIAPALERRLAHSPVAGHSGELKVSLYRSGLRLAFEQGAFVAVEPWNPGWRGEPWVEARPEGGDAAFPGLTFLQLLFGFRSLDELKYAFPDCWTGGDGPRALLEALFPKQASNVWHVS